VLFALAKCLTSPERQSEHKIAVGRKFVLKSSDHWKVLGTSTDLLAQPLLLRAEMIDTLP